MQHLIYVTDTVLALFISRSRARCNQLGYGLRVGDAFFSFPAHGRDATSSAMACGSATHSFHFPLTGEMQQRRPQRHSREGKIFISRSRARCNFSPPVASRVQAVFISRSRARCNYIAERRIKESSFSFPAHGRDATVPHFFQAIPHAKKYICANRLSQSSGTLIFRSEIGCLM